MPLNLSPESQAARDFAKRCVPDGETLDLGLLASAIFFSSHLSEKVPELASHLDAPEACRDDTPSQVPLASSLIPTLNAIAKRHTDPIDPEEWFVDLMWSPAGLSFARERGISEDDLNGALPKLRALAEEDGDGFTTLYGVPGTHSGWRRSQKRAQALKELNDFGRMLTEGAPPRERLIGMEDAFHALVRALVKRKQRSALVVGQAGTGKTALVRELARRLVEGHESVPVRLRDHDVFELSSTFLRSGATLVGEYDERVTKLLGILTENPKIILFVDEVHSLLQSGIHERSNYTDANEAFKQALSRGDFSLIGATTSAEYRYYLAPDQALVQRFSLVTIEPPTPGATLEILQGRRGEIQDFYEVDIPDEILQESVDLTEEYLLGRAQPRKSIQLLDEACAYCVTRVPPLESVTEDALWQALEATVGHSIARQETLTEASLHQRLSEKIVGQDDALRQICRAFVSGLGGWVAQRESPRGVFLFGGPTGVGKTETALLLSQVLGGGREALIRVDCNTLQPSVDSGQALNVLLGPAPGYLGYVRGKGGALSKIRDYPESIVLFDEIEKADAGVGEILLQIMDSGRCEDSDGNLLDFRRSFIVFTTNAGATYDGHVVGFDHDARETGPRTDIEAMKAGIRKMGLGEEFLGRITHHVIFRGLEAGAVRSILEAQLETLQDTAEVRGYDLSWDDAVMERLVAQWQPRFGVRHLLAILRNRIVEQLSVADAQGELNDVKQIRLVADCSEAKDPGESVPGMATRTRRGEALLIGLR